MSKSFGDKGTRAEKKIWESRRNPKGTHPIKPGKDPALDDGPNGGQGRKDPK